ncbi:flavonoid 3',5'-hydroxylase 1-like [Phoenix dactylifera]|uniref:Flavonoid 3',5'-hydroxylase 1-like n=1 Tax=Phoenix dactylifera TaxID=42345 RepID=A0A8B9APP4_PHODC|nr:flavonoid 3',5'-hydroxylase 1-like [Phoenix dactylifera]
MFMDDVSLVTTLLLLLLLPFLIFLFRQRLHAAPHLPLPPGPRGWPLLGALPLLGPLPHAALAALAKRHGPIMYLNIGTLGFAVASSPAAARAFLQTLDLPFACRPLNTVARHVSYGGQDIVFADYGPLWKLLRRLSATHLLGPRALSQWAATRRSEACRMVRSILDLSRRGEPVRVQEVAMVALANMLGLAILSRRVFDSDGAESGQFKSMVLELMRVGGLANIGDLVPCIAWLDVQGIERRAKRLHERFDALVTRMLREHADTAGQREGRPDYVDNLLANCKSSEGEVALSDANIKGLVLDMFIAGTDTSSIAVEWAIAELLKNHSILKRAHLELDEVIGRDRMLEESDIPKLPYLQAICEEVLRMHPTTPLSLPHLSNQACEVEGYYIPKGTRLLVNIWAIGRDPEIWENPLAFNPDRFLSGKRANVGLQGTDFELMPFGGGRRICAGKQLGILFVQYIVGTLLHSFDWIMPDGEELNMEEAPGLALQKAVPVNALAKPRLASSAYD